MADGVDFVLAAYCESGVWHLVQLAEDVGEYLDVLIAALWHFSSEVGTLALVSMGEEFFVIVRQSGANVRMVLSDVTAAEDHPLAVDVAEWLSLPEPDDDEGPQPAGEMTILEDLGLPAVELGLLCDEEVLYPDEILGQIAQRIGFGDEYTAIIW